MRSRVARTRPKRSPLIPRIKLWLEIDGDYAFGFGIATILQAVGQTGSMKQAAATLGKSYRYVWGRVKEAERALGRPLVETQVGGQGTQRSSLTADASRLVEVFLRLRTRLAQLAADEFQRCFG